MMRTPVVHSQEIHASARYARKVAGVSKRDAEQPAGRVLTFGDAVNITHGGIGTADLPRGSREP